MKKTKLTRSLLAACSIVALSVVLSGCLHSGGGDDEMDTGGTMPTVDGNLTLAGVTGGMAVMPGTYTVDDALAAAFAAAGDLDGVEHEMGAMVSVGGVDLTCATGPCQVDVNDDGTITVTGTIHTADYTPPPSTDDVAAEAMRIAMAIGPGSTKADSDTTTDGNQMPFHADGGTFREAETATPVTTDDYAESDMTLASLGEGWAGSAYTRMTTEDDPDTEMVDETVNDMVVVYTDQADPTNEPYDEYYSTTNAPNRDGVGSATAEGVLTLSTGADTAGHMSFSISFGLTANDQTLTLPIDNPDTPTVETDPLEFMGAFNGVDGTFACSANCVVTSGADGNLATIAGTWTFTPTVGDDEELGDIEVVGVTPDPDYMTMGYWLRQTVGDDGPQYAALAFAMGSDGYGDVSSVVGSAEYAGPATGLYMIKTLGPDGMPMPRGSGQFAADAALTANFGGTGIAADDQFSISGTVSNFVDANGDPIDSSWTVMLNRGDNTDGDMDMNDAANITQSDGTFSGPTVGMGSGGEGAAGTYSGTFHGTDDTATTPVDMPSSASGTFDGHFLNGHVYGAFGVALVPEDN